MKGILKIFKGKITIGLLIGTLITLIFAIVIKYLFECYLNAIPVRGGVTDIDLLFYGIILLVRLIVSTLIEYHMGESYNMPIDNVGNMLTKSDNSILKMDDKTSSLSKKGGTIHEGSGRSNKKQNLSSLSTIPEDTKEGDTSSSKGSSTESKMLTTDEKLELSKEFSDNLVRQREMVKRLSEIKDKHNLAFYLDSEGALELEGPSNMSEQKLTGLAKELGIIDRIINTKMSEYDALEFKDFKSNNGDIGESYSGLKKFVKDEHDRLFENKDQEKRE